MGERINVVVKTETGPFTIYSHWGGGRPGDCPIADTIEAAIAEKVRHGDESYAAAYIVRRILEAHQTIMGTNPVADATSVGIVGGDEPDYCGPDYPALMLDVTTSPPTLTAYSDHERTIPVKAMHRSGEDAGRTFNGIEEVPVQDA